jgi:hypothetical protein
MMPARKSASFEVVASEFSLEVLVDALGPPPLRRDAGQHFQAGALGQ